MDPKDLEEKKGIRMEKQLISLFEQQSKWTLPELEKVLELKQTNQFIDLVRTLNKMEDEKMIYNDHAKYIWILSDKYFVGKVKDISKFEFMVSDGQNKIYVQKKMAKDAFDKDVVLVKRGKKKGNRVIHIYSHGIENVIGEFVRTKNGFRFRSDIDLHTGFKVVNQSEFSISDHDKAVVRIVRYSDPLEVKIIRLLGPARQKGVDIEAMLYQNDVRMNFNERVEKEIEKIPDHVLPENLKGRRDFRDLTTVTIDGDTSKDFDDAVSIEKTEDGYRLYVHIADVSHYVKEGTAIDKEAYARATSVYVVDRVVPMLPFELSNGICSLNPDVDRLTMTAIIDINKEGEITHSEVVDSVIHSNKRCTYAKVNELLEGGHEQTEEEYKDVKEMLFDFAELAKILQKQTKKRGSIDFETKEPTIILDDTGKPVDIYVKERGFAEQMIEEAMIRANVAVAHALNDEDLPGIYRVHDQPDRDKLVALADAARAMHIPVDFNPNDATTEDIQKFLSSIEDDKEREVLGLMALRSMAKAVYSQECTGHFGLALPEYSHFTSPIRRYPDLIMHRMLKKYLLEKGNEKDIEKDKRKIETQAEHTSQKERDAIAVERAVNSYEMARYMEDKIGKKFKGSIVGVTNFGFFVELPNSIEGLVPARTLSDDYYEFDEKTLSLKGQMHEKVYRIGDEVEVEVSEVDVPKGLITFNLWQPRRLKYKKK
jgi:ribonuclease R